ncbi:MAG: hypothetical protein QOH84_6643 [Kribbellaceae bacterium]|jgi:hypothetical protein|nr:hypothetical protein [Kribbellaceae bacterium]
MAELTSKPLDPSTWLDFASNANGFTRTRPIGKHAWVVTRKLTRN